ncbi:MAG: hypothetical protein R3E86_00110 [Pseudomonadales bacterium]
MSPLCILLLAALALTPSAHAGSEGGDNHPAAHLYLPELNESYALGINEIRSDDFTKITGWRLSTSWYFGHWDGEDSAIAFVWQKKHDQMSFSTEGIRYTRRF